MTREIRKGVDVIGYDIIMIATSCAERLHKGEDMKSIFEEVKIGLTEKFNQIDNYELFNYTNIERIEVCKRPYLSKDILETAAELIKQTAAFELKRREGLWRN